MKKSSIIFIAIFSVNILPALDNPLVLINHDLRDGLISDLQAVELKTRVLLIPESLPDRYKFVQPDHIRCGLGIIDDAGDNYDQLPADLQLELDNMQDDIDIQHSNRLTYFTPEDNVQISYQMTGTDGLTGSQAQDNNNSGHPDYVENMGQYIEDALALYIDAGWINPLTCTSNTRFLVTIEYQEGTYGYVPGSSYHRIYMHKNLTDNQNKLTTAHELHHLVQHVYTSCDGDPGPSGSWYRECTSMWAEEFIYDELDGYNGYDQDFQNEPYRSLDYFESGGLYQYGSVLWNLYIHENFGDNAVKNIWETPIGSTISAQNNYFTSNGSNFTDEFSKFSAWCYFTGYRSNGTYYDGEFEEASNINAAAITRSATGALVNYTPPTNKLPDHLGVNYIKLNRGSGSDDNLLVQFDGDGNYNWNLKVFTHQGSFDNGFEIPVDLNGDGFTVLNNWGSYTAATINPIITGTTGSNANYILSLRSINTLLMLNAIEFSVTGDNSYPDPGERISVIITIANYGNTLSSVTGQIESNNSSITITDGTTTFGQISTNQELTNVGDPFIIDISNDAESGTAVFDITLSFNGSETVTEEWEINIGIPAILLVDDDNGDNTELGFIAAIDSLNESYEVLDRISTSLDVLGLGMRDIVIWNTGSTDDNGLSAEEKTAIMTYLDGGKNLFLTGNHLGEKLANSDLFKDYLEMRYVGYSAGGILRGVEGDPVGVNSDNNIFLSLGSNGIDLLSTYGDPRSSLVFYFNGDEEHGAVLRYSSPEYRVIFSAFNIATVSPPNESFLNQKDYVYKVLEYLSSGVQFPDAPTLSSPETGYIDTLMSFDENLDFSWSSADLDAEYTFFILDDPELMQPLYSQNTNSEMVTHLSYDTLLSLFGYVQDKEVYWGVYNIINGEVSISGLNSLELTLTEQLTINADINIPNTFHFSNAHPNPFNSRTQFTVSLPEKSHIVVNIYDIMGRQVALLAEGNYNAGRYNMEWDGMIEMNTAAPSGVYLLVVQAGDHLFKHKMILMK